VLCHRWWMFTAALVFCHQVIGVRLAFQQRVHSGRSHWVCTAFRVKMWHVSARAVCCWAGRSSAGQLE
jgi:hypothetical protein